MQAPSEPKRSLDEQDTRMTGTYIGVVVVEVVIITLLWILGRVYS